MVLSNVSANSYQIYQNFVICSDNPKKIRKFLWTDNQAINFEDIKTKLAGTNENRHYDSNLETRVECNASRHALNDALEKSKYEG